MRNFMDSGYRCLSIEPEHAAAVEELPAYHNDPFDWIIVAQALIEPLRLLTHDAILSQYSARLSQSEGALKKKTTRC